MKGYSNNIEQETLNNMNFRKVVYTGKHSQLVLMSLLPKEDIGFETHPDIDQFFRFEKGEGECIIDETKYTVSDGFAVIVPAGAKHNITNTSSTKPLKLYTVYSPPGHKDGIVHSTKSIAKKNEEKFDGTTTEKPPNK